MIGFFGEDGRHATQQQTLQSVAEGLDSVVFHCTTSAEVAQHYSVASFPALTVFKKFDGSREDAPAAVVEAFDTKTLEDFVVGASVPLVQTFSQETSSKIFGNTLKTHVLFFMDTKGPNADAHTAALTAAAGEFKGKALHIIMPEDQTDVMSYFSITEEALPMPVIIDMAKGMKQVRK